MRHLILVLLLCNCYLILPAQVNSDSLWQIFHTSEDSKDSLEGIDQLFRNNSVAYHPDTFLNYASIFHDLAVELNQPIYVQKAVMNIGVSLMLRGDFNAAELAYLKIDSLLSKNYDTYVHALLYINRGYSLSRRGKVEEALLNNTEGQKLAKEAGDKILIGMFYGNIAQNYQQRGNMNDALEFFIQAKMIAEELKDSASLGLTIGNIGVTYAIMGDLEHALPNFDLAGKIFEKIGMANSLPIQYCNSAQVRYDLGLVDESKVYFQKAIKASNVVGNPSSLAMSYGYLSKIYARESDPDSARIFLNLAKIIDEKYISRSDKMHFANAYALLYANEGDYDKAVKKNLEALGLARSMTDLDGQHIATLALYDSYKAKGNFNKALYWLEQSTHLQDSLKSTDNERAVIVQEFKYEAAKETALAEQHHQNELLIEEQKQKSQRIIIGAVITGLLFVIAFALLLFKRLKLTRQQKMAIAIAKDKAEESERVKEQFLANMSHEIRTPMHAISGMVKILKRKEHLPTQKTFLNAMHTSSDNLVVILNDVLDLSKIEAGKLDIESIPTSPAVVIENVTQILKYKAEEKGLGLNYHIEEEVPDLIMGDPTRLNQILINLAGNAIKFTEKGKVNILVQKENDRLKFSIKDTGIGIPKEKVETIFGAFEQAKDSTSRHYGGTGLGLSISKQLVELQQGKIWAESEEGKGSTFFVELPLVVAAANAVSENLITEDRLKMMATSLEGIRILLAEDNAFNQMIAQDDLSFFIKGVKIDVVENGALAVEKFQQNNYDLILMDVQMPEMNGFEATEKIREIEKLAEGKTRIPIIAMTASLLKSEIDSCRQAGMDNYIPKPYQLEELIGPIFTELKG